MRSNVVTVAKATELFLNGDTTNQNAPRANRALGLTCFLSKGREDAINDGDECTAVIAWLMAQDPGVRVRGQVMRSMVSW